MRFVNLGNASEVPGKLLPSTDAQSRAGHLAGVFVHPLTCLFIAGWLVNDHFLKAMYGTAITGKLSDVFGLAVFPLLVAAILPADSGIKSTGQSRVPHSSLPQST